MPIYCIDEVDRDYRAHIETTEKEFNSRAEAETWCLENSRGGTEYYVDVDSTIRLHKHLTEQKQKLDGIYVAPRYEDDGHGSVLIDNGSMPEDRLSLV